MMACLIEEIFENQFQKVKVCACRLEVVLIQRI